MVAPKSALESALEALAFETWTRLRDIKSFSQRPEPFNAVRFGETTITDFAMMALCRQGLSRSVFLQTSPHMEQLSGTDFEWWLGSGRKGWFRLAIQAKKLDIRQEKYPSLTHKVRRRPQTEILKEYATVNRATPLYCLYNYSDAVGLRHWHCCQRPLQPQELGCSLAQASIVQRAIDLWGTKTFDFIHTWGEVVPWQCVVTCPKVQDAFRLSQEAFRLGSTYPVASPFPLIDPRSYYPQLPPLYSQALGPLSLTFSMGSDGYALSDDLANYDMDNLEFSDTLGEYYQPDVGLPRSICITNLDS